MGVGENKKRQIGGVIETKEFKSWWAKREEDGCSVEAKGGSLLWVK
jgi:hypothetical protein